MDNFWHYPLMLLTGFIAGMINTAAGGGSVLTVGLLLLLGYEGPLANGTNRLGVIAGTVTSAASLGRGGPNDLKQSLLYGLFTLPGAVLGALFSLRISGRLFELILSVVMIGVLVSILVPLKEKDTAARRSVPVWLTAIVMTAIGFYGGFIQIGVGFLLMAALRFLLRLDLIRLTRMKVWLAMFITLPAMIVFAVEGQVRWIPAGILALGQAVGCWLSGKLALKEGEKIIKIIMVIVIVILAGNQLIRLLL